MNNESDVKSRVKKLLTEYNWQWWMPANNGYGVAGVHDFNCVRHGLLLTIETKFGKNTPTAQQHAFARKIRLGGGLSFMVNEERLVLLGNWLLVFDTDRDSNLYQAATAALSSGVG